MRFLAALALSAVPAAAQVSSASDLRDYAIASCLIRQDASQALKTEGYRLADIVIHRARIDPFAWKSLSRTVDAAFAKREMLIVHVDAPVDQATQPAVLASCLQVIDDPSVRRAMTKLRSGK